MTDKQRLQPVTMENVRILFRNFSGAEGIYNRKGDRNFKVVLDDITADRMRAEGWNVKELKPREEGDEPTPILEVKVNFGPDTRKNPRCVLITSRGRTTLTEEEIGILDFADIAEIDMIIRPYQWDVNGKTGVKAYLKSIYVTINEDPLELKYGTEYDSAANCVGDDCPIPEVR